MWNPERGDDTGDGSGPFAGVEIAQRPVSEINAGRPRLFPMPGAEPLNRSRERCRNLTGRPLSTSVHKLTACAM
jgi:hypothetical protein